MNLDEISQNLVKTIRNYDKILIYIKGSPDPDSIASAFALKMICSKYNTNADIVSPVKISLAQNSTFIKKINIPILFSDKINFSDYQSYAILDHQNNIITPQTEIPCAIHIDHHEKDDECIKSDFAIISNEVNSVSTIFAMIIKKLKLKFEGDTTKKISTALLFGLYTDTNEMDISNNLDQEAELFLKTTADTDFLEELGNSLFSEETLTIVSSAIMNHQIYKNWLISGIGILKNNHRDNIAIAADFLLERDDINAVVVFAIIENSDEETLTLDASFRTKSDNFDLNHFIKTITTNGGGRKHKGAFQVDLSYFYSSLDRASLLKLVNETTYSLIKEKRDDIHIIEIKGFFNKLKKNISSFFSK